MLAADLEKAAVRGRLSLGRMSAIVQLPCAPTAVRRRDGPTPAVSERQSPRGSSRGEGLSDKKREIDGKTAVQDLAVGAIGVTTARFSNSSSARSRTETGQSAPRVARAVARDLQQAQGSIAKILASSLSIVRSTQKRPPSSTKSGEHQCPPRRPASQNRKAALRAATSEPRRVLLFSAGKPHHVAGTVRAVRCSGFALWNHNR